MIENIAQEYLHWPSSRFKDPVAVENGIRLQKPPSEIASNWWSRKWLSIIASFGLGVRLQRAMMYASQGQVLKIEIENGIVKAFVQGSEPEPYRVIIAVKTIPKAVWSAILQELAQSSRFGICVASGSLPPQDEIETAFSNSGALLFPDRQGELQTKCSCPDWSNPCKHVAAVYLLLAAEFDRDPFLIFKLRGLHVEELFTLLSESHGNDDGDGAATGDYRELPYEGGIATTGEAEIDSLASVVLLDDLTAKSDADTLAASTQPGAASASAFDLHRFWKCTLNAAHVFGEWQPAADVGALAASLGEFPFWQSRAELLPAIRCVYEGATPQAVQLLYGQGGGDSQQAE